MRRNDRCRTEPIFAYFAIALAVLPTRAYSQSAEPINPGIPRDAKSYYAVRLVCPTRTAETLDYWLANPAGVTIRISYRYASGKPRSVKMTVTEKGKNPGTAIDKEFDAPMSPREREVADGVTFTTKKVYNEICLSTELVKSRYDALMLANRKFLGIAFPD